MNVDGALRDHVGVHPQQDGLSYVGFAPRVGRLDGELLAAIAALAERYGSGRVRTTAEQKMVDPRRAERVGGRPGRRA